MVHRFTPIALFAACMTPHDEPRDVWPDTCVPLGSYSNVVLPAGDGVEDRSYWLHVPPSYRCDGTGNPLLVDFHGTAGGGGPTPPEEAYQTEALVAFSDANGVIVARPRSRFLVEGGAELYQWDINDGDLARNVSFADNLVAHLEDLYAIDPDRVVASGFSSGANMAAQFLGDVHSPFRGIAQVAGGDWSHVAMPSLADGPRMYLSSGYRDYLWPYARAQATTMLAAGLPADHLEVRRTGGGHDLYGWHFDELWQFIDSGAAHGGGTPAAPWSVESLPSPADINAFADDAGTLVAAGAGGRLWRRDAGGWTLALDRGDADYTALCFGATGRALVGGNATAVLGASGAWGSGRTLPDYGGQIGTGWVNAASCRDDGSIVVVGYWSAAQSGDGGTTWVQFSAPTIYPGVQGELAGIATAPGGATVVVGYYDHIGRAAAGTKTASLVPHPVSVEWWNGVAGVAGGRFWVVGDSGAILTSGDDGRTWTAQASGTTENLYAVHFADARRGAAVGHNGTVVVTTDGGATWAPRSLGMRVYLGAVHVDTSSLWIAGENGLVASSAL
jgi:predicted esterase